MAAAMSVDMRATVRSACSSMVTSWSFRPMPGSVMVPSSARRRNGWASFGWAAIIDLAKARCEFSM